MPTAYRRVLISVAVGLSGRNSRNIPVQVRQLEFDLFPAFLKRGQFAAYATDAAGPGRAPLGPSRRIRGTCVVEHFQSFEATGLTALSVAQGGIEFVDELLGPILL